MAQKNNTEILILGTQHLQYMDGFEPTMLNKVLSHLKNKDFDVIALEQMPSELLYDIRSRDDNEFQNLYDRFGKRRIELAEKFQSKLNITFSDANDSINLILDEKVESTEIRRRLISLFLATSDIYSALLQKDYLIQQNKMLQLDDSIVGILNKYRNKNENYTIGVELAKQENINRLNYIDNLQDETYLKIRYPEFISEYQQNKVKLDSLLSMNGIYDQVNKIAEKAISDRDLIQLYKFLNSTEYSDSDFDAQWNIWFKTNFDSKADQGRFYLWEMRNLQIAANIIKLVAMNPGNRILVIIGSSHKRFIEKHLRKIKNIVLLDF